MKMKKLKEKDMTQQILTISKASLLKNLCNHEEGEIAYAADEDKYYKYEDGSWNETELEEAPTRQELKMTIYDMNKQLAKQMPPYDEQQIEDVKKKLREWKQDDVNLYMLYGKEISYFTLFQKQILAKDNFVEAVFTCLNNLTDKIYSFEIVDDNAIEFWVDYEDEATCMYLFNYDAGVVIYNG